MPTMKLLVATALLAAFCSAHDPDHDPDHDHDHDHDPDTTHSLSMGTASFLWPTPRPWSDFADSTPPCGSTAGVGNRTSFPLTNGRLALISQNDTRSVRIGVAYADNPTTIDDFTIWLEPEQLGDLEVGHTCIKTADAPVGVVAGSNATWMVSYTDEETSEVDYACADVVFVSPADFQEEIPCFNATTESDGPEVDEGVNATTLAPDGSDPHPELNSGGKGLSGGAISGIVVGVLAGVALVAVLAFFLWRRGKRSKTVRPAMVQAKDVVERAGSDGSSQKVLQKS